MLPIELNTNREELELKRERGLSCFVVVVAVIFFFFLFFFFGFLVAKKEEEKTMASTLFRRQPLFPHSWGVEESVKGSDMLQYQQKVKGLAAGGSFGWAGNFRLMAELRIKIMRFRDILDLFPCRGSTPMNELLMATVGDLQKLYPRFVLCPTSEMISTSTYQGLCHFYEALKSVGDSWSETHKWCDIFSNEKDDIAGLNLEQLGEIVLERLGYMNIVAKEIFDVMDEEEEEDACAVKNSSDSTSEDCLKDSRKVPYYGSPQTPTSVLPYTTPYSRNIDEFQNVSYSPPLLLPLRLKAMGKLNPIDVKRLPFQVFPHVSIQNFSSVNQINKTFDASKPDKCETSSDSKDFPMDETIASENFIFQMDETSKVLNHVSHDVTSEKVDDSGGRSAKPSALPPRPRPPPMLLDEEFVLLPVPHSQPMFPPIQSAPPSLPPKQFAPPMPPLPKQSTPPLLPPSKQSAPPVPPLPKQSAPPVPHSQPMFPPIQSAPPSLPPKQFAPPVPSLPKQSTPPVPPLPKQSAPPSLPPPKQSAPPVPPLPKQSAPPVPPPSLLLLEQSSPPPTPPKQSAFPPPLTPMLPPKEFTLVPTFPPPLPPVLPPIESTRLPLSPPPLPPMLLSKESAVPSPPLPPFVPRKESSFTPLPPSPMTLQKGLAPPPPPPLGVNKALRPKKANTKLKRSTQMGSLYRLVKGKVEGSSLSSKLSQGRKSQVGGTAGNNAQGMADALAEITKRSAYFRQIEEDVQKHAKLIMEMKSAINSFHTKDMIELQKFHQYVERHLEDLTDETQVLARFDDFPSKKLETIRTAAALRSRLGGIASNLENWKIEVPLARQLEKFDCYFNKIKVEVDAIERNKDEEAKRFQCHKIEFDFNILVRIKEFMVDVSSNCIEVALKESKEAKADANREGGNKHNARLKACSQTLWKAFQLAFRIYTFAGGQDDRADKLTGELAQEIETYANHY